MIPTNFEIINNTERVEEESMGEHRALAVTLKFFFSFFFIFKEDQCF